VWWKWNTEDSDPYVELRVGKEKKKTCVMNNTNNPTWSKEECHDFFVNDAVCDRLKVQVYDEDKWGSDGKMGYVEIPIINVAASNGMLERAFPLKQTKLGGTLTLRLLYAEPKDYQYK